MRQMRMITVGQNEEQRECCDEEPRNSRSATPKEDGDQNRPCEKLHQERIPWVLKQKSVEQDARHQPAVTQFQYQGEPGQSRRTDNCSRDKTWKLPDGEQVLLPVALFGVEAGQGVLEGDSEIAHMETYRKQRQY